jgi:hypothetical protein
MLINFIILFQEQKKIPFYSKRKNGTGAFYRALMFIIRFYKVLRDMVVFD